MIPLTPTKTFVPSRKHPHLKSHSQPKRPPGSRKHPHLKSRSHADSRLAESPHQNDKDKTPPPLKSHSETKSQASLPFEQKWADRKKVVRRLKRRGGLLGVKAGLQVRKNCRARKSQGSPSPSLRGHTDSCKICLTAGRNCVYSRGGGRALGG